MVFAILQKADGDNVEPLRTGTLPRVLAHFAGADPRELRDVLLRSREAIEQDAPSVERRRFLCRVGHGPHVPRGSAPRSLELAVGGSLARKLIEHRKDFARDECDAPVLNSRRYIDHAVVLVAIVARGDAITETASIAEA